METNRLTADEVAKLEEASNLLASGLPERIKRARQLINEVLYSAAPTVKNEQFGSFTRTPANFVDDDEGWD